jgi:hypothetical protein
MASAEAQPANLAGSVHIQCHDKEQVAQDVRQHLEDCFRGGEEFDPNKLADYKAIQLKLHGSPPNHWGDEIGFVKDSIVVIHAEEEREGVVADQRRLDLYLPIWDDADDALFEKDQKVHLYLYEKGRLLDEHDPGYSPDLYVGKVEMTNLPNRPVQHPANCTVRDFNRPVLSLLPGAIPEEVRTPRRQLVIGLTSSGRRELLFYHSGNKALRCRRDVGSRELTGEELEIFGLEDEVRRRPVDPSYYTPQSLTTDGRFVYAVPTDPTLSCEVNLPAHWLYPAEAEEVFRNRVHLLREEERSRLRVDIRDATPHRKYVYRCSYHEAQRDQDLGLVL